MRLLGAHMSIAGGYYKAVEAAARFGMTTCQLFTKNNNQWRAKAITDDEAARFRQSLADAGVSHPLSHSSYLINLASPDAELRRKSVDAMIVELQRAEQLGIAHVVLHPGAATSATEDEALDNVARALDEIHVQTRPLSATILLENTAGQGSCLGWRFEQLQEILKRVRQPERLGVCIDTCHAFAAGYDLTDKRSYQATFRELDQVVGLDRVRAFHLNDSKRELGSRVDRHEHIGRGKIGIEAFRLLLRDRRFRDTPMYLETPKGDHDGEEWDATNMRTLRDLLAE